MKKGKLPNPRSEASQARAIRRWAKNRHSVYPIIDTSGETICVRLYDSGKSDPLAEFDLRDCYRKRQPLTGIEKKLRATVQPKRRKS